MIDARDSLPYKALYIHVPFCRSKCRYCDFRSDAVDEKDPYIYDYIEDIAMQVFKLGREGALSEIETIYIGGGTPSFAGSKALTSLMYAIGLSKNLTEDIEVTVEANPDSFDERLAKDLFAMGVNRISIGVQSFDDEVLGVLGRPHTSYEAIAAIEAAKSRFDNISIDLMCGIPGQTLSSLISDLRRAIDLGVSHISIYPLTIENGTEFDRMVERGEMKPVSEDVVAEMMESAHDLLTDAGYSHYEVSNFARPGFESRHNMAYWQGRPYLGLGDGAVSMSQDGDHRVRRMNGKVTDSLTTEQADCEDLVLAMRTFQGVEEERLQRLDAGPFPGIEDKFSILESQGLVSRENGRYVPTLKGFLLGNVIYESILDFF